MNAEIRLPSYAKINLTLRVFPRRPDGYHDLESLVLQLDLHDDVSVRLRDDDVRCTRCEFPGVPPNEQNLAHRAAAAFFERIGRPAAGFEIEIAKRVPPGGGLGGGSSNAAAVLSALNALCGAPLTAEALARLGATLGSDVPLFFASSLSAVSGRGERVQPLAPPERAAIVLIMPVFGCPTGAVYADFDRLPPPPARRDLADLAASTAQRGLHEDLLFNDLQPAAERVEPHLAELARSLRNAGLRPHLSGSGSTLFLVAADAADAEARAEQVRSLLGSRLARVCCAGVRPAD